MGDFNFDVKKHNFLPNTMANFKNQLGKSATTTDANTQIDIVYSNSPDGFGGVRSSYFSDHSAIYYQTEKDDRVFEISFKHDKEIKINVPVKTISKRHKNCEIKFDYAEDFDMLTALTVAKPLKTRIFSNYITGSFGDRVRTIGQLCSVDSIFHGLFEFYQDQDIRDNLEKSDKPLFKMLVSVSKENTIQGKENKWLEFLSIIMPQSFIQRGETLILEEDISETAAKMFNKINTCEVNVHCELCNFTDKRNLEIISLSFNADNFVHLAEICIETALGSNVCKKCQNALQQKIEFKDFVILNPTRQGESMIHNEFKNVQLKDIPTQLMLNKTQYDFKFLINYLPPVNEFSVGHYTCFSRSENEFICIDDMTVNTTRHNGNTKVNPTLMVYFKLNNNQLMDIKLDEMFQSDQTSIKKRSIVEPFQTSHSTKRQNKGNTKELLNCEGNFDNKIKIFNKVTIENEEYNLMCPFNSFIHGMMNYYEHEIKFQQFVQTYDDSFLNTLLEIMNAKSDDERNKIWISHILKTMTNRHFPSTQFFFFKSYDMSGDVYDVADKMFHNLPSSTRESKCLNCNKTSPNVQVVITIPIQSESFENLAILIENRVSGTRVYCTVCQQRYEKIINYGDLIFLNPNKVGVSHQHHKFTELTLKDIPQILKLDNHEYAFKYFVNFEPPKCRNGIGHYTCYCLNADGFIHINDLPSEMYSVSSNQKINPTLMIYSRL